MLKIVYISRLLWEILAWKAENSVSHLIAGSISVRSTIFVSTIFVHLNVAVVCSGWAALLPPFLVFSFGIGSSPWREIASENRECPRLGLHLDTWGRRRVGPAISHVALHWKRWLRRYRERESESRREKESGIVSEREKEIERGGEQKREEKDQRKS